MTQTLVDTSALIALIDGDDPNHVDARSWLGEARGRDRLITHNYMVVEVVAVAARRFGHAAVRDLVAGPLGTVSVLFADEGIHHEALSAFLASGRLRPGLVDWVSFTLMRRRGITRAFAFDRDFAAQGFELVP